MTALGYHPLVAIRMALNGKAASLLKPHDSRLAPQKGVGRYLCRTMARRTRLLVADRSRFYISPMNEMLDNHELARKLAVLEERMNTHQAAYETALERIERRMAERDAEFAKQVAEFAKQFAEFAKQFAEFAKRDVEAAKRETRLILATGGMIAIAAAVLGALIKF